MNQSQNIPSAPSSAPLTTQTSTPTGVSARGDDFLALIRAVRLLWKHKWWIALGTFLFTAGGVAYALIAEPVYTSSAIIAPKEPEKGAGAAGLLSQMGDMGGLLASQMGMGGTTLERIAIIAKSHDLAQKIITKYKLLPYLFHNSYNFKDSCWMIKNPKKIPDIRRGSIFINKSKIISVSADKKRNIINLHVSFYDSVLAAKIANYYLAELDNKIRGDIIREARSRRAYLDAQMKSTADPWIMQKLQFLVGMEMEKSMMVAGSSFDILETPMVPLEKTKPFRRKIVMTSFIIGLLLSCAIIYMRDYLKSRYSSFDHINI